MINNTDNIFYKQLKNSDYELYLTSLFQKNNHKKIIDILKLYLEISSIPNKINDKMIGFIRLAWWREAFEQDEDRNHQLLKNIKLSKIQRQYFINIIEAIDIEIEAQIEIRFEEYINKKYVALFKLISEESIDDVRLYNLAVSFFLIIEVIVKNNTKYNNFLLKYKTIAIGKLEAKQFKDKFLYLLANIINFYKKIIDKNLDNFESKKYRFLLILYLSYKHLFNAK